jgi:hypothetical protein
VEQEMMLAKMTSFEQLLTSQLKQQAKKEMII